MFRIEPLFLGIWKHLYHAGVLLDMAYNSLASVHSNSASSSTVRMIGKVSIKFMSKPFILPKKHNSLYHIELISQKLLRMSCTGAAESSVTGNALKCVVLRKAQFHTRKALNRTDEPHDRCKPPQGADAYSGKICIFPRRDRFPILKTATSPLPLYC